MIFRSDLPLAEAFGCTWRWLPPRITVWMASRIEVLPAPVGPMNAVASRISTSRAETRYQLIRLMRVS